MTALVTLSDIQAIESISSNVNFSKKVLPHILDAQEFDVRPLVGEELWVEIAASPGDFTDLMSETTYTHGGHTYQHPGLKNVIVMYAVARYKAEINMHDTAHGLVVKNTDYSNPVSDRAVARAEAKAKAGAEVYWTRVRDYLCRKSSSYPLWRGSATQLTGNGLRIRKVSKR